MLFVTIAVNNLTGTMYDSRVLITFYQAVKDLAEHLLPTDLICLQYWLLTMVYKQWF